MVGRQYSHRLPRQVNRFGDQQANPVRSQQSSPVASPACNLLSGQVYNRQHDPLLNHRINQAANQVQRPLNNRQCSPVVNQVISRRTIQPISLRRNLPRNQACNLRRGRRRSPPDNQRRNRAFNRPSIRQGSPHRSQVDSPVHNHLQVPALNLHPNRVFDLRTSLRRNLVGNPAFSHPHGRLSSPQHNQADSPVHNHLSVLVRSLHLNRVPDHRLSLQGNRADSPVLNRRCVRPVSPQHSPVNSLVHNHLSVPVHSPRHNQVEDHRFSLLCSQLCNQPVNRQGIQLHSPRLVRPCSRRDSRVLNLHFSPQCNQPCSLPISLSDCRPVVQVRNLLDSLLPSHQCDPAVSRQLSQTLCRRRNLALSPATNHLHNQAHNLLNNQ